MKILKAALALFLAAPLFGAYQYYYTDTLTGINLNNWYQNGTLTAGNTGLTSNDGLSGALISKLGVPGSPNDYEVRTTVNVTQYGGDFIHYLRASSDANRAPAEAGSYYSVGLESVQMSSDHLIYTATLIIYKRVGGVLTQLASTVVGCPSGTEMRSIIRGSRLDVWVNGIWYLSVTDTSLPTGGPGIGVRNTSVNTISRVDLGPLDTVAPSPVNAQSIATYALANSVDMQWQGADDGPNGIGVAHYLIYRGGAFLQETTTAEFTDATVAPGQTYQYAIAARDYHLNDSTQTSFSVTTPPAGSVKPRRIGVRPLGAYWGAAGEQIDTLSGNLNFTLPLVKAMGRNGWSANFGLSYNSQLWRQDPAATWKLGRDVGYGFGWRFQAGSLTPYWQDPWTIHHYLFVDSTGAEYRLGVSSSNGQVWSSQEGLYLTFDRVSNRLYFPDGSFWVMGCSSFGSEQDAGTRYPTVMEDSNGNQLS
jgi:hypothetical protein